MSIAPPHRSLLLAALFVVPLAALMACEGGGNASNPGEVPTGTGTPELGFDDPWSSTVPSETVEGAPGTPAPQERPAACQAVDALAAQQGDLVGWLQSVPIQASGSEGFVEPSDSEVGAFKAAFAQLLQAGPTQEVAQQLSALGYTLSAYRHTTGGLFLTLEENAPRKGRGTFVVNPQPARNLWLEAPHADYDKGTLQQGANQLVQLGARALLITGAHRCANAQATPCSGTSAACGGTLRISDAAHNDRTFFQAAHEALRATWPDGIAVSLHGMESQANEAAVISDGTREPAAANGIANALRDELNAQLTSSGERRAFSCNDPADDGKFRPLCGTTNVQGRHDNLASNACTSAATSSQSRFIHLEQDDVRRRPTSGPDATAQSLAKVFGCSLAGNGLGCAPVASVCQ